MTEIDVKNLILERMAALIPNATNLDLSYMAGTLKTLESLGKPDFSEKYLNSLFDAMKKVNEKTSEEKKEVTHE